MDPDFVVPVKCTIFWMNRGVRVYLDLYAPDFSKSYYKSFVCTEVVRKNGFWFFTAMCTFWKIQCIQIQKDP